MIFITERISSMNGLTTGNLLRNGDFSQLELDGQPSIWNTTVGQ
ncbi:unnamed protein product, partial [Rotaria magnacalcarata]